MSRYYFDTIDGGGLIRDKEGHLFGSREEMRRAAIRVLPDMARDELPESRSQIFIVRVRDDQNCHVFHASLSLVADDVG